MNTVIEPPKRTRKKGTRAAKHDAAARGISWSALSKSQRSYLRLPARTESGSKGALKKFCTHLGGPVTVFITHPGARFQSG